eukprot:CAMPEP_0204516864 /NCGR_PEP_ID=MMETSP0661-20131031/3367_1 /ASSEMBLY_ACC=CAM_ASM_000606 /TAXON_ID=109239 /ORGANISM="Alexandrium margalefi, Strain AMGDE01CS-322" /LENGTH=44 /DNA_ID= /DNA_START= /DNA_END= /DNA_ORIENTATION=
MARLPLKLRGAAGRAAASHKSDFRVTNIDLIWDVRGRGLHVKLA